MLNRLIGTEPVEIVKSVLLAFVTLIAAIALQQLTATRSTQTAGQADRSTVLQVSADFGQQLTTYDYAHPDVQLNHLTPLVTPSVLDRVRRAMPDLALYRAVSVGQPPPSRSTSQRRRPVDLLPGGVNWLSMVLWVWTSTSAWSASRL